jgi:hypothetical protein
MSLQGVYYNGNWLIHIIKLTEKCNKTALWGWYNVSEKRKKQHSHPLQRLSFKM